MSKRILVIGHAGHGKDTVCEILRSEFGLTFVSSSMWCATNVVMPAFEKTGTTYVSAEECFADRVNHRAFWYNAITEYNSPDRGRLTREIFNAYDIYCGLRNGDELKAAKSLVNLTLWVDASKRVPPEDASSCTIDPSDADVIIDNNGDLQALREQILAMAWRFK